MNEKIFTFRQVFILVLVIVTGIAFIETPTVTMWTLEFWRVFLFKVLIYGAVVEFIVILLGSSLKKD